MSQAYSSTRRVLAAGVTLILSLFAPACAPAQPAKAAEHPIVKMAMFDLDCPRDQLQYTQIDAATWGVAGCGRRTKYVRVCRQVWVGGPLVDECRWMQN
jgi:hypothetical protein